MLGRCTFGLSRAEVGIREEGGITNSIESLFQEPRRGLRWLSEPTLTEDPMPDDEPLKTSLTLLGRLRRNPKDQAAWSEFVARYGPRNLQWCRGWGLQESDAQDVTQDVLLRLNLLMARFVYDPSGSFRGWLKTLAHAEFRREVMDRAMERVRHRVSERTWDAFRLTALEGLSGAAAAGRLEMQIARVYGARSEVKEMIREEVRKLEGLK